MKINWSAREVDVFLALADSLSFRRTALQMHLSQSAVSGTLARLASAYTHAHIAEAGAGFVAAIFVAPGTGSGNRIAVSTPGKPRSPESFLNGGQTRFQRAKIRHHQTDMAVDDLWGPRRQVKLLVTSVDPHII
jgi:hypothetical protein